MCIFCFKFDTTFLLYSVAFVSSRLRSATNDSRQKESTILFSLWIWMQYAINVDPQFGTVFVRSILFSLFSLFPLSCFSFVFILNSIGHIPSYLYVTISENKTKIQTDRVCQEHTIRPSFQVSAYKIFLSSLS